MRTFIIITLFISCAVQRDRPIRIGELGWTLVFPAGVTFVDSAFDGNGNIRISSWDSSLGKRRLLLFKIQPKPDNYFNCIIFVDSSDYPTWQKATISTAKYYFYGVSLLPNYKIIDTTLATYKIDGIDFQEQYLKCYNKETNDTLYAFRFSRLYKNYDININIQYTDPNFGKQYLEVINKSKFEN